MAGEVIGEGKFLRILKKGHWEYVERHNCTGIVVLLPVTREKEVILVEQHRIPVGKMVIELPAGLVGDLHDKDEPLELAAERELVEETGYKPGKLVRLIEGPPSAGLSAEEMTFFGALDLEKVGEGGGDESEDIVVHLVPLDQVGAWLEEKEKADGVTVDPKVYAGLYLIEHKLLKLM